LAFVPLSETACHPDDLKKDLEEITQLHRQSIDLLINVLKTSSHSTITNMDFGQVLHTRAEYDVQKENYVKAVIKIYSLSRKLNGKGFNNNGDGQWERFYKITRLMRNKTSVLNQSCFKISNTDVDPISSDGENVLVEKLLKAVLEMFIAETFLNEHFNHLIEPYSKI
jgi:hypothetical protein